MKREQHSPDQKRRRFLRDAAMAGAGVAAAVSLPGLAAKSEPEETEPSDQAKRQKGYRLTPHIAAYYKTMTS
ncbi:MAG: hypothetical protein P8010_18690 [Desulfosarcinaceae bacterium]|jgi:nitrous oxide reductase